MPQLSFEFYPPKTDEQHAQFDRTGAEAIFVKAGSDATVVSDNLIKHPNAADRGDALSTVLHIEHGYGGDRERRKCG